MQMGLKTLKEKHKNTLPLSEFAYLVLKDATVHYVLPENQNLNERFLAGILKLSRTRVHDALTRLETEGLVQRGPSGGVQISPLTLDEVRNIFEIRLVLEGLAARLAAEQSLSTELARLDCILEKGEVAADKGEINQLAVLCTLFHETIAQSSRNKYLSELISRFHNSIQRMKCVTLDNSTRIPQALLEHRRLAEAIKAGDGQAAENISNKHLAKSRETYIRLYEARQVEERILGTEDLQPIIRIPVSKGGDRLD